MARGAIGRGGPALHPCLGPGAAVRRSKAQAPPPPPPPPSASCCLSADGGRRRARATAPPLVYSASLVVRLATDGTLALLTPASFPRLHAAYKVTEVSSCTTVSAYEDLLKSEFKVVSWRRCADSYRNSEEHDRQVAVEKAHVLLAALHDFWEQRFRT